MKCLRHLCEREPVREGPPRRGFAGQRLEREHELIVRRHAVLAGLDLLAAGWRLPDAANFLQLAPRTWRDWRHDLSHAGLPVLPLGRPIRAARCQERNDVIHLLDDLGPGIGLPTLRTMFPTLARAALADILGRYRRLWRRLHQQSLHVLHWSEPGRVWAVDFHGPRPPVDGRYPDVLAVRDLASGQQLLWLPVRNATAATLAGGLTSLFAVHGAPLVLKSDNGSAFGDRGVQRLCDQFGVENLFSPPRMPRYNGSIEAGIGSLTSRTEQAAARRGYPGAWTWDDTATARLEANATARPRGPRGPCPDELWSARTPLGSAERQVFQQTVAYRREEIEKVSGGPLSTKNQAKDDRAIDRQAIGRALVEHGYLRYTRRRIYPPIRRQKTAGIM
jgi:transposase InsO family protein